jgi:dTDP-N-acetylfucosamine:lipid II N-acetylfucosaminyltransferase
MNYHFFVDDKFFDEYIEEQKLISNNNVFVFTFEAPAKYIKSNEGIFAPYGSVKLKDIVYGIKDSDTLTIHWFSESVIKYIISNIPEETKIYLQLMGGDFLEMPKNAGINNVFGDFLYEPLTEQYVKLQYKYYRNSIFKKEIIKFDINIFRKIHSIFSYFSYYHKNFKLTLEYRRQFLKRLTAIMNWNEFDVFEIEKLYKLKLTYIFNTYTSGLLDVNFAQKNCKNIGEKINFLVGNSGNEAGNHLDAFSILKKFTTDNINFYSSLSYGNQEYINYIIKKGFDTFGNHFIPITQFMNRDKYYDFFENIDICVMNHKRTNAGGNIMLCLKKGIPIFLNPNSTIFKFLIKHNFNVFSIHLLNKINYEDLINLINKERLNSQLNSNKIDEIFSQKNRFENLKKIYCI